MELAEVSEFRSPYLSVKEVIDFWEVSERTLRRRLASGAPDCHQDDTGQWCLSAEWVDSEFHRRRRVRPVFPGSVEPQETDLGHHDAGESHESTDQVTIDLTDGHHPTDDWIQELLAAERRATQAETELKLRLTEIESLKSDLLGARSDLKYERSLVNRLKDQLRGTDI